MIALIGGLRGLISAIAGAAAAFLVFWVYDALLDDPRVRDRARVEERIVWTEARNKLLAQMAEERRRAQRAIDEIEREYLSRREQDAEAIASLEEELARMEAADEDGGNDTRLFIPERLSRHIDAVGR